jgi:hypothetical protein
MSGVVLVSILFPTWLWRWTRSIGRVSVRDIVCEHKDAEQENRKNHISWFSIW